VTGVYFHQGSRPVRKSVSVQVVRPTLPSKSVTWLRAKLRGAGPRTTLPSLLYWDPWHGHMNLFSALFHGTTQPKWVHTATRP